MRILVAAASKHGATTEIAEAIGATLQDAGHEVDVDAPDRVPSVDRYDAVVVGSAVYAGHWLDTAKAFVHSNADALRNRPVWLFSSGPIGDPPKPDEEPVDVSEVTEASGALSHHVFAGKLDRDRLHFGERAIVRALRVAEGDFRDWDAIRSWARAIGGELTVDRPHPSPAGRADGGPARH
jgi:menaquinone-dependent protoporphyrinogen oxidase